MFLNYLLTAMYTAKIQEIQAKFIQYHDFKTRLQCAGLARVVKRSTLGLYSRFL